ncbi:type II toxin-antitoxin system VapC family toxin [Trichormus sp. NMC-1]|uniref:type II toxin-antitoxin system VapC family toxin n=1 Tax=Trichormus sp. NMC-1 TaxID=1853259 RepID=UPI0008DBF753|nr:type II toxin-antitoxin system VapC family toxin [Trichormus sp. NMC-1]
MIYLLDTNVCARYLNGKSLTIRQRLRIRAELSAKGIMIGSNDLQIAAIAMANNLILVTHNVKEFSRVNGLPFEDWEV